MDLENKIDDSRIFFSQKLDAELVRFKGKSLNVHLVETGSWLKRGRPAGARLVILRGRFDGTSSAVGAIERHITVAQWLYPAIAATFDFHWTLQRDPNICTIFIEMISWVMLCAFKIEKYHF